MALSKEYYGNLSAEELAQDDFFIESVQKKTTDNSFWNEFLIDYPHQRETFDEAVAFVQSLHFSNDRPAAGVKERIWNNIKEETSPGKLVSLRSSKKWMWAAAAITILIACSAIWMITMNGQQHTTMGTAFGQTRQVILPDQSIVMLNANSSIEFDPKWDGKAKREVWLKGEAFFDVKHLHQQGAIKESDRFVVHVGNTAVEVLGTSFNVSDRRQVTKVVLQTGSVRVDFADKNIASVMMSPGEMMQYDQQA
ncbi:MAG TPA: FecR domain-containing protein, partial [Chitinophagaceae bacterium]|nr:FecR domain-containing protein [Chitinophagaceae bacterium]